MKVVITIIVVLLSTNINCQETPFFEQIALQFYDSIIQKKHPIDKKIVLNKYTLDLHRTERKFIPPNCSWHTNISDEYKAEPLKSYYSLITNIDSDKFELDISNIKKKRYRIRKNGKGRCPKLFISLPHKYDDNSEILYINIEEKHSEQLTVIYHLQLALNGEVINWCRNEQQYIIVK